MQRRPPPWATQKRNAPFGSAEHPLRPQDVGSGPANAFTGATSATAVVALPLLLLSLLPPLPLRLL